MWSVLAIILSVHQPIVRGTVRDAVTRVPVSGAVVHAVGTLSGTLTDSAGAFALSVTPPLRLRISRIGYATVEVDAGQSALDIALVPAVRALEGVTVRALRTESVMPQRVVQQEELEQRYSGQEMPVLLAGTPSITTYSDGGAYSNYTYFRIRGIDQTRVNITLDGVPLNDPEDQGVFFSNFPDFGNSIQSVQVQRGVGTSSLGVASYAGSINFESIALHGSARRGEVQLSRGDFNTTRASAEWQSGVLPNRTAFHGRISSQLTDGYRRHAGNRSTGAFISAGYFGDRTSVKLTALSGVSRNELAYLASPIDSIRSDPRHNPLPATDRDRFTQSLVSLATTRLIGSAATASATVYTVRAGGDYDVTFGPDISNFNLRSSVTGALATYSRQQGLLSLDVGGHANAYTRDHFLLIRPDLETEVYRNTGDKKEASAFAKATYVRGRATASGDLQVRQVWYAYEPDAEAGIAPSSIDWGFINPRVGLSFALRPATAIFVSFGLTGREPTRNDLFAGFDNVDTTNAAFLGPLSRVRPEHVRNAEAGISHRGPRVDLSVSAFNMTFRDEITPIGALSYIGLPLRKNVRSSYRRGLEIDGMFRGLSRVLLGANLTWTRNRIAEYTDDGSGRTFRDVKPLLTPSLIANQSLQLAVTPTTALGVEGRYVSESQLANDDDARFTTPSGFLVDLSLRQRLGALEVLAQLRNVGNRAFFSGGYHDGAQSYYYVTPPRNLIVTTRLHF